MNYVLVHFKPKKEGFESRFYGLIQKNDKVVTIQEDVIRRLINLMNKTQGEEFDEIYEIIITNTKECPPELIFSD